VDPGAVVTGFGVIDRGGQAVKRVASGVISMKSSEALSLRLEKIYEGLLGVIDEHHPDEFSIETAFYGKNVRSTLTLGHVRGVAILAAVHRQLGISEYSPREVKRALTGTGAAAKQQVEFMVKKLLNIKSAFKRSDEADALAVAICHAFRMSAPRNRFTDWSEFAAAHPERIKS
jgi:crossover junction endodeoxyribonuclease RuvC